MKVIFACVHNAGRSQMASAFFNQFADQAKACAISAGTQPAEKVHEVVLLAMQKIGIDLSSIKPQLLTNELAQGAERLVTMGCGEACPQMPGLKREDWPLPDPKEKTFDEVCLIRDQVKSRVLKLLDDLNVMATAVGVVRMATEEDAAELLSIYAPYIENTSISFEFSVPTETEFRKRIADTLKIAPWLVCVEDERIIGYAYGGKHRERQAYSWSCDVSVYIAPTHHGRGVGRLLYTELISRVIDQGFCNAFAGITLPNAGSVALHESMGFKQIGIYRSVGFKMNKWHDVGWWQKRLSADENAPKSIRTPQEMGWL